MTRHESLAPDTSESRSFPVLCRKVRRAVKSVEKLRVPRHFPTSPSEKQPCSHRRFEHGLPSPATEASRVTSVFGGVCQCPDTRPEVGNLLTEVVHRSEDSCPAHCLYPREHRNPVLPS